MKIKNCRKLKGYTQESLCSAIDIDTSGYSNIENGKNFPSFETLCLLFSELEINPSDFFDFIKSKSNKKNLKDLFIIEQIKSLSDKDKQKLIEFIKIIKE